MLPFRFLVVGVALAISAAGSSAQNPVLQQAMREKLSNAQQLLQPIVTADFPVIARYSDRLSRITETEIASWQAVAEPEYVRYASLFLLSVDGLREAAEARNIEAAGAEYTALVSSCVRCHTYVRGARAAMPPLEPLGIPSD